MEESSASKLADFVLQLDPYALPAECLDAGKRCFIDYFAVTLAGSKDPISKILERYLTEQKGTSSVIGCSYKTSLEGAAFANGTLGHILDYDDVKPKLGHATVVIAPAVLVLGEALHKNGSEILTAFVAGFEIASRIANSVEPVHSQKGWHTMGTCSIFGAAVACGKLLRLDKSSMMGALGVAASFSSGLRKNMGTPTKSVHAGQAAQKGLKAAILASLGIYGAEDIFSGPKSFGEVFSSPHREDELTKDLGERFEIFQNGFKIYPCCASSHSAIDAILELREKYDLRPEDVEEIRVGTVPLVMENLVYNHPKNIVECRFSMHFCISLALVDGHVTLDNFSQDRLDDLRIQSLMKKVKIYHDPEMANLGYRGTGNANVTVITKQRLALNKRVDAARGHVSNPVTDKALLEKFRMCTGYAISRERSERIHSLLTSFEKLADIEGLFNFFEWGCSIQSSFNKEKRRFLKS
jgi:2-methylcitrate dehydratase PrpD